MARAKGERKERAVVPHTQENCRKNEMCRKEEEGGPDLQTQVWVYRAECHTTQIRRAQHRQLQPVMVHY